MFIRTTKLTYNTIFADCNYCPFKLRIMNNDPLKCNPGRFCGRMSCKKLHTYLGKTQFNISIMIIMMQATIRRLQTQAFFH